MAHLRSLERRCEADGCDKRAVVELYNTYNAPSGVYCLRHGQARMRDALAAEKRAAYTSAARSSSMDAEW